MEKFVSALLIIVLAVLIFIGVFQGTFSNEMTDKEDRFEQKMDEVNTTNPVGGN